MGEGGVVLVAMPWQPVPLPSLQLGILQSVLERTGVKVESRSLYLAFMDHCCRETAERPPDERIGILDYQAVAVDGYTVGLGDWIFAVPPFRPAADPGADYQAYLHATRTPAQVAAKAVVMRGLVPDFLDRCAGEIVATGARLIGFTSTFSQTVPSLALAKVLKHRDPSLIIILGGANCDGPKGAALHRAFPWVDVVVRGEAEGVLPDLVKDLLAGGPVRPRPGICYREAGRPVVVPQSAGATLPMDEISTPRYGEYFDRLSRTTIAHELAHQVRLPYETARGCWWGAKSHCTFCGFNGSHMAFRSKSPGRVLRELAVLARRHGRLDFQVVDNILDLQYLRDVFPRLRDAGHDLSICLETKANLKREQIGLLRQAGVDHLQPGIESLSTPILRLMRKGVTAFQCIRLLKWCAEYGIHAFWNIIYGFPAEPPEEYARMAALVPSLAHLQAPSLFPLSLERFSPYHEQPAEWGLEVVGPAPRYRFLYPADEATLAELAHCFEYRHVDGRDPETYVGPLRGAIEQWQANEAAGYRALRYRRGPDFLMVRDRRPGLEPAEYTFEDLEARIYLACEDGATPRQAWAALGEDGMGEIPEGEVRQFLDELVAMRLVYEEHGRYLGLALPAHLPEHRVSDVQ